MLRRQIYGWRHLAERLGDLAADSLLALLAVLDEVRGALLGLHRTVQIFQVNGCIFTRQIKYIQPQESIHNLNVVFITSDNHTHIPLNHL